MVMLKRTNFEDFLEKEPMRKAKALVVLGGLASVGLYGEQLPNNCDL
jgi:hypothetical protein